MTDAPTERQVLYALVSAGFLTVVAVLIVGAAAAGLVPTWWSVATSIVWLGVGAVTVLRWRDTRMVLLLTIALFVAWTIGTLVVS